jgi:adenylate cyclase
MIEKERKFLLKYMPDLGSYFNEPKLIKQGYLILDKKKHLRIRITNNFYCHICYKESISKSDKYEFEYLIPKEQGFKLYELSEFKLEKKRYTTFFKEHNVDIDVYPSGLSVVEIEFIDELIDIPDYCGKEITGIKKFSNREIAKMNNQFFA